MFRILTPLLFGLFLSGSISAQCDLVVETTDFTCDSLTGDLSFRLVITGSDSVARLPEFGIEFPIPMDEVVVVPALGDETLVFNFESGTAPDLCFSTAVITSPEDCTPPTHGQRCQVNITANDVSCGIPGSLTALPTGAAPFTYSWNTGDTTATIPFGETFFDYAVTITDATGCASFTSQHYGGEHPFSIHVESGGTPCLDGSLPSLTATTFGAQAPFTYSWSTGDSTETITDVVPEVVYSVTITDATGCSSVGRGIYHPGGFAGILEVEGPTSTNCDGSPVTLSVIDPDPDFEYRWEVGNDTLMGASITTLTGGLFRITGFNPENPACVIFGSYYLTEANLSSKDLAIVNLNHPCETAACLAVVNTNLGFTLIDNIDVTWSSTTDNVVDPGVGFICVEDPATYEATIRSPCDTFTLTFILEEDFVCTQVCGTIIMDMDQDCTPDNVTHNWNQTVVLVTNDVTNVSYPVHPNPDGTFCAELPKGSYTISVIGEDMTLSTDCNQVRPGMEIIADNPAPMDLFASMAVADTGGNETTSTRNDNRPEINLLAYPNPSNGNLRFDFTGIPVEQTDVLSIYDGLGRALEQTTVAALPQPWRPRNLRAGIYQVVLRTTDGRAKARTKVVVR